MFRYPHSPNVLLHLIPKYTTPSVPPTEAKTVPVNSKRLNLLCFISRLKTFGNHRRPNSGSCAWRPPTFFIDHTPFLVRR